MFERLTEWNNGRLRLKKQFPNIQDTADILIDRLAAYEDSGLTPEEVQELAQAKAEGKLVELPCKVGDLTEKYRELTKPMGDEIETYTTGYQNGYKNGQAELLAYLLQIDTGTREAAEKAMAEVVGE